MEISAFEKAITSYDYDSKKYGYKQYVDVGNVVDYFIINEFTKNMDAGRYSTYIYKRPKEKFKFCVWDFNNCCENFPEDITGFMDFAILDKPYFESFTRDEDFIQSVVRRYFDLRKTYLSENYLMNYIEEAVDFLGDAKDRNNERWKAYIESDEALNPVDRNVRTHREAVGQLKSFLINRGNWLDENIDALFQYSAESKIKAYEEVTE